MRFRKTRLLSFWMVVLLVSLMGTAASAVTSLPENTNIVADIVEKSSPAVVNIDTLKIATYRSPLTPFFNDPLFRRFLKTLYPRRGKSRSKD